MRNIDFLRWRWLAAGVSLLVIASGLVVAAQISPRPPVVLGGLLVVPRGLIDEMTGRMPRPNNIQVTAARARVIGDGDRAPSRLRAKSRSSATTSRATASTLERRSDQMRIESIFLRNYRVFRNAELTDLPSMATVVGANGSGKSTLLDAMSFLKDALTENVAEAVERRGGFRELVSRGESGPISIILHLVGSSGLPEAYRVDIAEENDRPVVQRELFAVYERSRDENPSSHFIDVSRGVGVIAKDKFAELEQPIELENPNALAIKGLGQFKQYQAVVELSELLENWHVSDFHIQEAQPSTDSGFAQHLSARGNNLTQVARFLYEHHRDRFDRILELMRVRVPGLTFVEAKLTVDDRLVLRFQDGSFKDPFIARHVSDGTIKMFAYLVLLHDPKPHPVLGVEEPENQLYPALLRELAEEFRDYARRGGQVFVSTHSPEFLNGVNLDEIYWLVKEDGFATVRRASDSELLRNLYAEGDLPGALWKQGLFEGADPE